LLGEASLFSKFKLEGQALHQVLNNDQAVGYLFRVKRNFPLAQGHMLSASAGYFGKFEIDTDALFVPSFANYYMGEIMRMDAWDVPIVLAELKHKFPGKTKTYVRLRAVKQLHSYQTGVLDMEVGAKFFKHIKLTGIFSVIDSEAIPDLKYMARIELRAAF
jgi:hypothetical protein